MQHFKPIIVPVHNPDVPLVWSDCFNCYGDVGNIFLRDQACLDHAINFSHSG